MTELTELVLVNAAGDIEALADDARRAARSALGIDRTRFTHVAERADRIAAGLRDAAQREDTP